MYGGTTATPNRYRDLEEMMLERGVDVDSRVDPPLGTFLMHPNAEIRVRSHLKPTNDSRCQRFETWRELTGIKTAA